MTRAFTFLFFWKQLWICGIFLSVFLSKFTRVMGLSSSILPSIALGIWTRNALNDLSEINEKFWGLFEKVMGFYVASLQIHICKPIMLTSCLLLSIFLTSVSLQCSWADHKMRLAKMHVAPTHPTQFRTCFLWKQKYTSTFSIQNLQLFLAEHAVNKRHLVVIVILHHVEYQFSFQIISQLYSLFFIVMSVKVSQEYLRSEVLLLDHRL